ncbi:MAG TPA: circularly permuted type 2 ATP-grasp protein [Candidatus Eisenbacteria bacterium]|nr:circularly permuted type 2 ATP-grasp protein [Candidatus Eisenbacteria bacterium]
MSPLGGTPLPSRAADAYDEFYRGDAVPRDHYRPLWDHLRDGGHAALAARARATHVALRSEGVTFTARPDAVAGDRVWPFDPIPRIIPGAEWALVEAGVAQRIRAFNCFVHDLYHTQRVLKDGVVPAELVYASPDFRRDIVGVEPPHGIYTHIGGIDLVRDEKGRYLVAEDNLRIPSGVSFMIENRIVERRAFPELFGRYRVRHVEDYPAVLLRALRSLSPRGQREPRIVVLTPGMHNAAYLEHAFLAHEMDVALVEGRDLVVSNDVVHLKTTRGRERVDVVYRRVDDLFLDPLCFRPDSLVGVAGIVNAWRAGNVAIVNAPGTGIADDKAIHPYVPAIIRYYLGEPPLLDNVPTYQMTNRAEREWVLANLDQVVVKRVNESGGYGMLVGPTAPPELREAFSRRIAENPRSFVAQAVVPPSRHVCACDDALETRHVDLRPFVVYGDELDVVPGGLTRVALSPGALVVDAAHGGGSKDTWVLAAAPC